MDKITTYLKKMDLFGVPVSLVINRQTHYNTLVGSFASIIGILFVTIFFRENFLNYITKNKVEYQIENEYSQYPELLNISSQSFMFALGIEQPHQDFVTNPFFNITVIQTVYQMNGEQRTKIQTNIDMEPCQAEHFKLIGEEQFQSMKILSSQKNFICPKLHQNLDVEGLYTNSRFSFIRIYITRCNQKELPYWQNSWKPQSCGSDDYFNSYIKSVKYPKLLIYTSNFNINPQETEQYAKPYIQDQQTVQFSPYKTFKNIDLFVKHVVVNTDNSIIFDSVGSTESFITFDPYETIITQDNYIDNVNQPFIQIQLRRSQNTIKIKRSFKKLTELMYQIGGLVKSIFLLLELFVSKYNKFQYRLELANKLYDFELSTPLNQNEQNLSNNTQMLQKNAGSNSQEQHCLDYKKNKRAQSFERNQSIELNHAHVEKRDSNQTKNIPNYLISTASGIVGTIVENEESPQILRKKQTYLQKNNSSDQINDTQINCQIDGQFNKQNIQIQLNNLPSILEIKDRQQQNSPTESIKNLLSSYFQQIISRAQRMKSSLSYFLNYISFRYFFNTEKNYLIRKAQQFTKRDLDIYVILDKLQEIEKLKKIFLDEEQLSLFNFFPKPIIRKKQKLFQNKSFRDLNMQKITKKAKNQSKSSCSSCSSSSSSNLSGDNLLKERQEYTTIEAYQNLYEAYQILKKDKDSDKIKINQKLFQELGSELLNIFNQPEKQKVSYKQQIVRNSQIGQSIKLDNLMPQDDEKQNKNIQKKIISNETEFEQKQIQRSFIQNNQSLYYDQNQQIQENVLRIENISNQMPQNQLKLNQSNRMSQNLELQSDISLYQNNEFQRKQAQLEIASENNRHKPCIEFNFIKHSNLSQKKNDSQNKVYDNNNKAYENKIINLKGVRLEIKSLKQIEDDH